MRHLQYLKNQDRLYGPGNEEEKKNEEEEERGDDVDEDTIKVNAASPLNALFSRSPEKILKALNITKGKDKTYMIGAIGKKLSKPEKKAGYQDFKRLCQSNATTLKINGDQSKALAYAVTQLCFYDNQTPLEILRHEKVLEDKFNKITPSETYEELDEQYNILQKQENSELFSLVDNDSKNLSLQKMHKGKVFKGNERSDLNKDKSTQKAKSMQFAKQKSEIATKMTYLKCKELRTLYSSDINESEKNKIQENTKKIEENTKDFNKDVLRITHPKTAKGIAYLVAYSHNTIKSNEISQLLKIIEKLEKNNKITAAQDAFKKKQDELSKSGKTSTEIDFELLEHIRTLKAQQQYLTLVEPERQFLNSIEDSTGTHTYTTSTKNIYKFMRELYKKAENNKHKNITITTSEGKHVKADMVHEALMAKKEKGMHTSFKRKIKNNTVSMNPDDYNNMESFYSATKSNKNPFNKSQANCVTYWAATALHEITQEAKELGINDVTENNLKLNYKNADELINETIKGLKEIKSKSPASEKESEKPSEKHKEFQEKIDKKIEKLEYIQTNKSVFKDKLRMKCLRNADKKISNHRAMADDLKPSILERAKNKFKRKSKDQHRQTTSGRP